MNLPVTFISRCFCVGNSAWWSSMVNIHIHGLDRIGFYVHDLGSNTGSDYVSFISIGY